MSRTPKEHVGIQMDPWMSCSWKRTWNSSHPPNTQTKEKIRKYRLQKAGRRISLFRTAGGLPIASGTATGLPDQNQAVITSFINITITKGHHLQPSQLSEGTRPSPSAQAPDGHRRQKEGTGQTPLKVPLKLLPTINSQLPQTR